MNPSTLVDEPFVSFDLVADADAGSTLTVSFTFDEDMDVTRDPSVSFDPDVASTLIQSIPQGSWEADAGPSRLRRLLLMRVLILTGED